MNEECNFSFITDIAVAGGYAYVTTSGGNFFVVDVSHPTFPFVAGDLYLGGSLRQVAIAGTYAYIAAYGGDLDIVDITHPSATVELGVYPVQGDVVSVATASHYAYAGAETYPAAALHIIDVADPAHPSEVGIFSAPGGPSGSARMDAPVDIAISGDYAYLATGVTGLRILDISDPAKPVDNCAIYIEGGATGVAVDGDRAYVAKHDTGLIDIVITNTMTSVK